MGARRTAVARSARPSGAARRGRRHGRPRRRLAGATTGSARVLATSSQALWYLTRGHRRDQPRVADRERRARRERGRAVRESGLAPVRARRAAQERRAARDRVRRGARAHRGRSTASPRSRIVDVFVPFVGIVPADSGSDSARSRSTCLLAVIVTSLLRERIGLPRVAGGALGRVRVLADRVRARARYRQRHALPLGGGVNVACLVAVLIAVLFRLGWTRTVSVGPARVAALGSVAIALGVVAWMVVEPMRPGWARKAGTPSALLASARVGRASRRQPTSLPVPFSSAVRGSLQRIRWIGRRDDRRSTIDAALPPARATRTCAS